MSTSSCNKKNTAIRGGEKLPKYCHADRDGECIHPLCPQKKDWKPICPAPKLAEEG